MPGVRDDLDLDVGDCGAGVLCVGSGDHSVALAPDDQDWLRDPGEPFVGQRPLARPAERSVADRPDGGVCPRAAERGVVLGDPGVQDEPLVVEEELEQGPRPDEAGRLVEQAEEVGVDLGAETAAVHQHEPRDAIRRREGGGEGDRATERVPDEREPLEAEPVKRADHGTGQAVQVVVGRGRLGDVALPMTGEVERNDVVGVDERPDHSLPGRRRAADAVDEHDRRGGARAGRQRVDARSIVECQPLLVHVRIDVGRCRLDVLAGDAPTRAGRRDRGEVDAEVAGALARSR